MQRLSQKCTICQREFIEQSSCAACFRYEVEGRVDLYVAPQASIAEPVAQVAAIPDLLPALYRDPMDILSQETRDKLRATRRGWEG